MKLLFSLMVVVSNPTIEVDPKVVPYQLQQPTSYVIEFDRYATSEACQAEATSIQRLAGKPLPGVRGRVMGAHCLRK